LAAAVAAVAAVAVVAGELEGDAATAVPVGPLGFFPASYVKV
jgi:hypothetical protein